MPYKAQGIPRRLFLGTGIGGLASELSQSAEADTTFTDFRFPATGAPTRRTMPDRLADIINVKDYGAYSDGTHPNETTTAIQAAVNAALANLGGVVFFPPGNFLVNNQISFNGDSHAGIRIVGSGGGPNPQYSSRIYTTSNNYIFAVGVGGTNRVPDQPLSAIDNLNMYVKYQPAPGTMTSTDTGWGAIYLAGGTGVRITRCDIQILSGIAIFSAGQNLTVNNCNLQGAYSGAHASDNIGVIMASGFIGGCKMNGFGYAICVTAGGGGATCSIANIDIEVCGCGIALGYCPIPYQPVLVA
jgi:hypothetical protein